MKNSLMKEEKWDWEEEVKRREETTSPINRSEKVQASIELKLSSDLFSYLFSAVALHSSYSSNLYLLICVGDGYVLVGVRCGKSGSNSYS